MMGLSHLSGSNVEAEAPKWESSEWLSVYSKLFRRWEYIVVCCLCVDQDHGFGWNDSTIPVYLRNCLSWQTHG